jgi:uncharacterized protein (TIGR02246 family)
MFDHPICNLDSASRQPKSSVRRMSPRLAPALLAVGLVAGAAGSALAGDARDEGAIRALGDGFASAFVHKDAERRASLFAEDGTFVTPPGDYLQGRAAMVQDFGPEAQQAVNNTTAAAFSNYRIRFINHDVAAVDARLTVRNANGPNGSIIPVIPIDFYYVAVRHGDGWLIEDGRTHFAATPVSSMGMSRASR